MTSLMLFLSSAGRLKGRRTLKDWPSLTTSAFMPSLSRPVSFAELTFCRPVVCEIMAMVSAMWSAFMWPHTGPAKAATGSGEADRYCSLVTLPAMPKPPLYRTAESSSITSHLKSAKSTQKAVGYLARKASLKGTRSASLSSRMRPCRVTRPSAREAKFGDAMLSATRPSASMSAVCRDSPLTARTGRPLESTMNSTTEAFGNPGVSRLTDRVARVACLARAAQVRASSAASGLGAVF
mmetsp:Transcript_21592/g.59872  ORF Transcript_21592/g.59872 Transcript_21592/m.59872 type:complete len:238 (-) Transcript_21592:254-967(-)